MSLREHFLAKIDRTIKRREEKIAPEHPKGHDFDEDLEARSVCHKCGWITDGTEFGRRYRDEHRENIAELTRFRSLVSNLDQLSNDEFATLAAGFAAFYGLGGGSTSRIIIGVGSSSLDLPDEVLDELDLPDEVIEALKRRRS